MVHEFSYIGSVSSTARTVPLFLVPPAGPGVAVFQARLYLEGRIPSSRTDYWIVEIGSMAPSGQFSAAFTYSSANKGLMAGPNFLDISPAIRYDAGVISAVRLRPFGSPAALSGAAMALAYRKETALGPVN